MNSEDCDPFIVAEKMAEAIGTTVKEAGRITRVERQSMRQALQVGVVPKLGLHHLQVGRRRELKELGNDVARIAEGGASLRFVIGDYGAGKTFFLTLVRRIALDCGLVVITADVAPARRLHGAGGEARSLLSELTQNLATGAKPEGGALASVVEGFIAAALREAASGGYSGEKALRKRLAPLEGQVGGADFALAVTRYARGWDAGDAAGQAAALGWLRAEYASRADARAALGVHAIVDDAGFYGHLKLLARFVVLAGYAGLLVLLDEMGQLHRITNPQARAGNYELLLRILNDVLQGGASHLGFVLSGTPELVEDRRRGLFSDPALQSRLVQDQFGTHITNLAGPVMRLERLSAGELEALLRNIRDLIAMDPGQLPDAALSAFLEERARRLGGSYIRTPRQIIIAFMNLLTLLEHNPDTHWQEVLGSVDAGGIKGESALGAIATEIGDDELAAFRL